MAREVQNDSFRSQRYPNPYGFLVRRPGCGAEIIYPSIAPTLFTAGLNAFGAWTLMFTTVNDFYPNQFVGHCDSIPSSIREHTIELGIGATGVPAIDCFRTGSPVQDPTADAAGYVPMSANNVLRRIPANSAIYARAFCSDSVTARNYNFIIAGWDGAVPNFAVLPSNMQPQGSGRYYPTNTTFNTITSAIYPAWSVVQQVVASAPNDMLVTDFAIRAGVTGGNAAVLAAFQVGIGPAGSESWVATAIWNRGWNTPTIYPHVWVRRGERLAVRVTGSVANTKSYAIKVHDLP